MKGERERGRKGGREGGVESHYLSYSVPFSSTETKRGGDRVELILLVFIG